MNQTDKPYQLTFTKERVIEFNSISDYDGYLVRTWKHFKSVSDFAKYIQDLNFPENQQISVLSNEKGIVQILTIPSDLEAPKEKKFKSQEAARKHISKHKLKPSISVCEEEVREVVMNFFEGRVCFFPGYKDLISQYLADTEGKQLSDAQYQMIRHEYENRVIDQLYNTI